MVGLLWRKLFRAPVNLWWDAKQDMNFSLGEQIYLQWEIKIEGNPTIYSYTIDDVNHGKFWLRSNDNIVLSNYVWFVQLTWIIEKIHQDTPIVRVLTLSGTLAWSGDDTNIVLDENWGVYILWAWIQFLPSFFDEYVLLNEWENGKIRIQNIETEKEIVLDYFRCNSSDPNRNCKWLNEAFENNNAQSFVTSEWDVYYKQSDGQSWFVANGDWWGISIKGASDEEVREKLKDLIKFANEKNINEWIKSRAMKICQWSWEKLQSISNSEISLKQEWLVVTVSWNGLEKQLTCQILVDFSLPTKWTLQSLTIWDEVVIQEQTETQSEMKEESQASEEKPSYISDSSKFDTNVAQFPIKEEWLVYNSNRWWYSLKFPSSNISYSVSSVKENFGRNDVNCSYVINVIKYSEKENLEVSPAVRIYECSGNVDKSWSPDILVYPRAGKKFVVKMNDGAWYDFSMNLKIEQLESE